MAGPVLCTCGAVLLEGTDAQGVTLVGGEYIRFKRKTDYVVCPECMSVYKAEDLISGGTYEDDEEDIEKLERLAEKGSEPEGPEEEA